MSRELARLDDLNLIEKRLARLTLSMAARPKLDALVHLLSEEARASTGPGAGGLGVTIGAYFHAVGRDTSTEAALSNANTAFRRLRKEINEAATRAGQNLELHTVGENQLGVERRLEFWHRPEPEAGYDSRALDAARDHLIVDSTAVVLGPTGRPLVHVKVFRSDQDRDRVDKLWAKTETALIGMRRYDYAVEMVAAEAPVATRRAAFANANVVLAAISGASVAAGIADGCLTELVDSEVLIVPAWLESLPDNTPLPDLDALTQLGREQPYDRRSTAARKVDFVNDLADAIGGQVAKNEHLLSRQEARHPGIDRQQVLDQTGGYPMDLYGAGGSLSSVPAERKEAVEKSAEPDRVAVVERLVKWATDTDAESPPLAALLGESGSGKTITSQQVYERLYRRRIEGDATVPYTALFDLRDLTGLGQGRVPTLEEIIDECVRRGWVGAVKPTAAKLLARADEEPTVFIFDGLDEALVNFDGSDGRTFASELLKPRPKATMKVLLSCRDHFFADVDEQASYFTEAQRRGTTATDYLALKLKPLTDEQIRFYLSQVMPEGCDVDELLAQLAAIHDLSELTSRPFTLAKVAEHLPTIRAAAAAGETVTAATIYHAIIRDWLTRDGGKHQVRREHKVERLLPRLAAWAWRGGSRSITASTVNAWFWGEVDQDDDLRRLYGNEGDAASSLGAKLEEDLRTATFLVRDDREGEGGFRFAHTSFQEFFVADYLLRAVAEDRRSDWDNLEPSAETLAYLAQSLTIHPEQQALVATMNRWRSTSGPGSRLLLRFGLEAYRQRWPGPALAGFQLHNANLDRWRFETVRGRPLNLTGIDLTGCSLQDTQWSEARVAKAKLVGVCLDRASLDRVNLSGADLSGAALAGAFFHRCQTSSVTGLDEAVGACRSVRIVEPEPNLKKISRPGPPATLRLTLPGGHTDAVYGVALDAEAGIIVTTSRDNTARVWDLETHQQIGEPLTGHTNGVNGVALDAEAGIIVTTSSDNTGRVWDLETHQQIGEPLTGHTSWVSGVALDAEAGIIVTTSWDETARVWDLETHQQIGEPLTGHTNWVNGVALDAEAGIIVTTSRDNTARVWDLETHQQIGEPLTGHTNWVNGVALDAEAGIIVTTSSDNTARVWDLETHQQIGEPLTGHTSTVNGVALDAEAGIIVTTSSDNTARVWDLETHQQIGEPLTGHTSTVNGVALDAEAGIIVTTSSDNTARVWDLETHQQIGEPLTGHTSWVSGVALDAEAGIIVTTSWDETARVWDLETHQQIGEPLTGHTNWVNGVALDAEAGIIVTTSSDNTVRVWDLETHQQIGEPLTGHTNWVNGVALDAEAGIIVTTSWDNTVRVWDLETHQHIGEPLTGHTGSVYGVALDVEAGIIVTTSSDNTGRVWDLETHQQIGEPLTGHTNWVNGVALDVEAGIIVTTSDDDTARVWDLETHQQIGEPLTGHTGSVYGVALDAEAGIIVTTSSDETARVWDLETHQHIGEPLTGHTSGVYGVALDVEAGIIVTTSWDGTARVWDLNTRATIAVYRHLPGGGHASYLNPPGQDAKLFGASDNAWRYLFVNPLDADGRYLGQDPYENHLSRLTAGS